MDFLKNIFSPITITFLIIFVGCVLGKIKIFNISLDVAAVLIVSILFGFIFQKLDFHNDLSFIQNMNNSMSVFNSLGSALFVSVIGIQAGYSVCSLGKKEYIALIIGSLMSISGFVTMKVISGFKIIGYSELLGALCGSLTTTPGLSVANEIEDIISDKLTLGYGSAYAFGVIITVISVQILSNTKTYVLNESVNQKNGNETIPFAISQICIAIVFGRILGCVKWPILDITFGNTAGILCTGVITGFVSRKICSNLNVSENSFNTIKNLGLAIFFVGNGFPAGMNLVDGLNISIVFFGIIMTVVPITVGWLLSSKIFKISEDTPTLVSGGMTSTPAIAVLTKTNNVNYLPYYSFAYIGALFSIILIIKCF